jgi:hypothetical protein
VNAGWWKTAIRQRAFERASDRRSQLVWTSSTSLESSR